MFTLYDKEAYELLKKCSDKRNMTEWNKYREENRNKKINFRFSNLSWFYLKDANLKNVDFRFAIISKCNMLGSDVENAKIANLKSYALLFILFSLIAIIYVFMSEMLYKNTIDKNIIFSFLIGAFSLYIIEAVALIGLLIVGVALGIGLLFHKVSTLGFVLSNIEADIVGLLLITAVWIFVAQVVKKNMESFAVAKNPELAVGFDLRYKKENIDTEIQELKKEIDNSYNGSVKSQLNDRLKTLEMMRKQGKTIEKAIEHIKTPYEFLDKSAQKLRWHNRFFYVVISLVAFLAVLYIFDGYINQRSVALNALLSKPESSNFGSILGIVIFYGSPVVFSLFIVMYSVSQINRNLEKIDALSSQKHFIDILESTFKAKTAVEVSDEELSSDIKRTSDALRDSTIAKILDRNIKIEETQKEERYRDRLDYKAMMPLLTALLKSKG